MSNPVSRMVSFQVSTSMSRIGAIRSAAPLATLKKARRSCLLPALHSPSRPRRRPGVTGPTFWYPDELQVPRIQLTAVEGEIMSGTGGAPARGVQLSKPIGIYYEHPDWYRPLVPPLDARGVNWQKIHAGSHSYDVALREPEYSLVFNRMSPSAWQRGLGHVIFYTMNYLQHLETQCFRVANG